MPVHDDLGLRMKTFYEHIPKMKLMRRVPVCIRLDGKAFHTFTRNFEKPFDYVLIKTMQETAQYLCQNIQGCILSYQQSDEISLILIDYQKLTSDAWFDYEVQKICSVAASMCTMAFNKFFNKNVEEYINSISSLEDYDIESIRNYVKALQKALDKGAMFDARCFNLPKEEVANYIYWRQLDATRNSIQMVGQAYFSHKELHAKTCNMIQDMLHEQKGINWNDYPIHLKRGSCCKKVAVTEPTGADTKARSKWIIDKDIPIFKNDGRKYIEDLIYVGEE